MLNDDEVKKALECCKSNINRCNSCPIDQEKQDACTCGTFLAGCALDLINRKNEEYEHLLKIARKMHTWIFLNAGDEQAAYDEIGLSDEDNIMLGYGGQMELTLEKKEKADNDR